MKYHDDPKLPVSSSINIRAAIYMIFVYYINVYVRDIYIGATMHWLHGRKGKRVYLTIPNLRTDGKLKAKILVACSHRKKYFL